MVPARGRGHVTVLAVLVVMVLLEVVFDLGLVQVPEGRQLFDRMSVEDNLRMGTYRRRDAAATAGRKKFALTVECPFTDAWLDRDGDERGELDALGVSRVMLRWSAALGVSTGDTTIVADAVWVSDGSLADASLSIALAWNVRAR